jgi:hypothetical protein
MPDFNLFSHLTQMSSLCKRTIGALFLFALICE